MVKFMRLKTPEAHVLFRWTWYFSR